MGSEDWAKNASVHWSFTAEQVNGLGTLERVWSWGITQPLLRVASLLLPLFYSQETTTRTEADSSVTTILPLPSSLSTWSSPWSEVLTFCLTRCLGPLNLGHEF